jgi:heme exporter protein A
VTNPLFETRSLYKRYGREVVLRDVTMQIMAGESIALLGANGAGKSTLLRILATLSRPSRGQVLAFGEDTWSVRDRVRERIGFVGHQPYIYPELSCQENLRFFAAMFGLPVDQVVPQALELVGLADRRDAAASTLSRGLLQRLNLARAILHKPDALILDEPDTGLDRAGRVVLESLVAAQVERGAAVVLTTHSFEYGLSLASRVVGLREGSLSIDRPSESVSIDDLDLHLSTGGVSLAASA